jgi:hypothetical protein
MVWPDNGRCHDEIRKGYRMSENGNFLFPQIYIKCEMLGG